MSVTSGGWVSQHSLHLMTVVVPTVGMLLVAAGAELRARRLVRPRRGLSAPRALARTAAVCSLIATAVHVRVAPEHFHEAAVYGAFFTVAAVLQLGWAALMLVRPQRWTVVAGVAGNAAMVALWLVTRSVGVPLGPGAGETEPIGRLDLLATGSELAVVLLASLILLSSRESRGAAVARPHPAREGTMATARPVGAALSSE